MTIATALEPFDFGAALWAQHPRLYKYALCLVRGTTHLPEDLVQSTLERALSRPHLWQPGTNLRAWLMTMMHNLWITEVRQDTRSAIGLSVPFDLVSEAFTSSGSGLESQLNTRDLARAIGELSPDCRLVVILVGIEGMSYAEAAVALGIPPGTVRSRLSRARALLREHLNMPKYREKAGA